MGSRSPSRTGALEALEVAVIQNPSFGEPNLETDKFNRISEKPDRNRGPFRGLEACPQD